MKKKILASILCIAMILTMLPMVTFAALPAEADPDQWDTLKILTAEGQEAVLGDDYTKVKISDYSTLNGSLYVYKYTLKKSGLTVSSGGSYYYSSSRTEKAIVTVDSSLDNTNITLQNVNALKEVLIPAGKSANITLLGTNNVDSIYGEDATETNAKLTFGGTGSLTANHIGGDSSALSPKIEINGGTYTINGGFKGYSVPSGYKAGIGGGQYGSIEEITINGGSISVKSDYGAAIGGGQDGYAKNITINGGEIKAEGSYGAAIGGGQNGYGENITINGGKLELKTSRGGIGGGQYANGKNISITGGDITILDGAGGGALIGGGQYANAEDISITGGKLRLETRHQSANKEYWNVGIGAGSNSAEANTTAKNITIKNTDIVIMINPTTASMQNKGYGFAVGTPNESTDATNVSMNCGVYNGNKLKDAYHATGYSSYLLSNYTYIIGKTGTVEVVEGKLTAGKFVINPFAYVAEGYTVQGSGDLDCPYEVVKETQESEQAEIVVDKPTETKVNEEITDEGEKEAAEKALKETSVTGVASAITEKGKDEIVKKAVEQDTGLVKEFVEKAVCIDIAVTVKAEVKEIETKTEATEEKKIVFELKPYAVITATSEEGEQQVSGELKVDNKYLAMSASKTITVQLGCDFKPEQVLHIREDGEIEAFNEGKEPSYEKRTFTYKNKVVTLEITQFSEVQLLGTSKYVNVLFDKNGGTGEMEAKSVEVGSTFTLPKNGFNAPLGKEFKAWSIGGKEYASGDIITVSDNLSVKAVWVDKATPDNPDTGDHNNAMLFVGLGGVALLAIIALAVLMLKKKTYR